MLARVFFWLARVVVFARVVKYFLARESLSCLRGLFYSLPLCGSLACLGLSSASPRVSCLCVCMRGSFSWLLAQTAFFLVRSRSLFCACAGRCRRSLEWVVLLTDPKNVP